MSQQNNGSSGHLHRGADANEDATKVLLKNIESRFKTTLKELSESKSISERTIQELSNIACESKYSYKHISHQIDMFISKNDNDRMPAIIMVIYAILKQVKEKFDSKTAGNFNGKLESALRCAVTKVLVCPTKEKRRVRKALQQIRKHFIKSTAIDNMLKTLDKSPGMSSAAGELASSSSSVTASRKQSSRSSKSSSQLRSTHTARPEVVALAENDPLAGGLMMPSTSSRAEQQNTPTQRLDLKQRISALTNPKHASSSSGLAVSTPNDDVFFRLSGRMASDDMVYSSKKSTTTTAGNDMSAQLNSFYTDLSASMVNMERNGAAGDTLPPLKLPPLSSPTKSSESRQQTSNENAVENASVRYSASSRKILDNNNDDGKTVTRPNAVLPSNPVVGISSANSTDEMKRLVAKFQQHHHSNRLASLSVVDDASSSGITTKRGSDTTRVANNPPGPPVKPAAVVSQPPSSSSSTTAGITKLSALRSDSTSTPAHLVKPGYVTAQSLMLRLTALRNDTTEDVKEVCARCLQCFTRGAPFFAHPADIAAMPIHVRLSRGVAHITFETRKDAEQVKHGIIDYYRTTLNNNRSANVLYIRRVPMDWSVDKILEMLASSSEAEAEVDSEKAPPTVSLWTSKRFNVQCATLKFADETLAAEAYSHINQFISSQQQQHAPFSMGVYNNSDQDQWKWTVDWVEPSDKNSNPAILPELSSCEWQKRTGIMFVGRALLSRSAKRFKLLMSMAELVPETIDEQNVKYYAAAGKELGAERQASAARRVARAQKAAAASAAGNDAKDRHSTTTVVTAAASGKNSGGASLPVTLLPSSAASAADIKRFVEPPPPPPPFSELKYDDRGRKQKQSIASRTPIAEEVKHAPVLKSTAVVVAHAGEHARPEAVTARSVVGKPRGIKRSLSPAALPSSSKQSRISPSSPPLMVTASDDDTRRSGEMNTTKAVVVNRTVRIDAVPQLSKPSLFAQADKVTRTIQSHGVLPVTTFATAKTTEQSEAGMNSSSLQTTSLAQVMMRPKSQNEDEDSPLPLQIDDESHHLVLTITTAQDNQAVVAAEQDNVVDMGVEDEKAVSSLIAEQSPEAKLKRHTTVRTASGRVGELFYESESDDEENKNDESA